MSIVFAVEFSNTVLTSSGLGCGSVNTHVTPKSLTVWRIPDMRAGIAAQNIGKYREIQRT